MIIYCYLIIFYYKLHSYFINNIIYDQYLIILRSFRNYLRPFGINDEMVVAFANSFSLSSNEFPINQSQNILVKKYGMRWQNVGGQRKLR